MRTVHKFELGVRDEIQILIDPNFKPVLMELQHGIICLWAEVDTDAKQECINIICTGTGLPVPPNCKHIGSVQTPPYVWHFWNNNRKAPK